MRTSTPAALRFAGPVFLLAGAGADMPLARRNAMKAEEAEVEARFFLGGFFSPVMSSRSNSLFAPSSNPGFRHGTIKETVSCSMLSPCRTSSDSWCVTTSDPGSIVGRLSFCFFGFLIGMIHASTQASESRSHTLVALVGKNTQNANSTLLVGSSSSSSSSSSTDLT